MDGECVDCGDNMPSTDQNMVDDVDVEDLLKELEGTSEPPVGDSKVDTLASEPEEPKDDEYLQDLLKDTSFEDESEDKELCDDTANAVTADIGNVQITGDNPEQVGEAAHKVQANKEFDLTTKEGRAQARIKLAQKGMSFNELSDQAHPKGSVDVPNLDVKPTVDGAQFHVFKDLKDAMMDLAHLPPKVRKQAEEINRLVSTGQLDPHDVDFLVSNGVDADAVKYWKQYFGEAKDPESKEFANKLTEEHGKFKMAEQLETEKAKIKRAYELAYAMQKKGMIDSNQVETQVGEIMKWNDEGFESVKRIVKNQESHTKTASVPEVGMLSSGDVILPSFEGASNNSGATNIKGFFDDYFAGKKL
jgi:hypothetical protein